MTETIQRAARAIAKVGGSPFAWDEAPIEFHNSCREAATACIETLLDPSEEAVEAGAKAGFEALSGTIHVGEAWDTRIRETQENYRIMVRAAIRAYHMKVLGREG